MKLIQRLFFIAVLLSTPLWVACDESAETPPPFGYDLGATGDAGMMEMGAADLNGGPDAAATP